MISNYLKVAFRSIFRNRLTAFINIAGLALAMACALLIYLYITNEISYDKYNSKADRIYRITRDFKSRVATLIRKHIDTSRRGRTDDEDFMWDVKPRHFVTDNEAEIELVSVDFSRVDYTIIYKLIGSDTLYSTATEPKPRKTKTPTPKVEVVAALTIENNEPIQLVEYSDKSFALIGLGTKAIKDELTKYGKFNRHLKCGAGWIFSNKHLATIKTLIGQ